jgi:hypothetical protein
MLEANKHNSKVIAKSSSINYFNMEFIVMTLFRASLNNQWFLDYFRTQVITTKNKQ